MRDTQKAIDFLKTLRSIVALMRNPKNTNSVFDVEDSLRNREAAQLAAEYAKQQPGVADLFEDRYLRETPTTEELLQHPEGSLGYAYGTYLQIHGFDPDFYRKVEVEDDVSYMFMRMRQTHDIWHVVTGFDSDVKGELGLKAFEIAQVHRTLSALLVCGGIMRTLFDQPEELDGLLEQIAIGYRMGKRAKPLLAQKWEEHWEKPLDEWRKELNIQLMTTYTP